MNEFKYTGYDKENTSGKAYMVKISFGKEHLESCINNMLNAMSSKMELNLEKDISIHLEAQNEYEI